MSLLQQGIITMINKRMLYKLYDKLQTRNVTIEFDEIIDKNRLLSILTDYFKIDGLNFFYVIENNKYLMSVQPISLVQGEFERCVYRLSP